MSHLTCSLLTQYLGDQGEVMEMVLEVMIRWFVSLLKKKHVIEITSR